MSDLEGQYFRRIQVLEAERDRLQAELTRLSGKTNFCPLCEGYAKERDELKREVQAIAEKLNLQVGMWKEVSIACDSWKAKCEELQRQLDGTK